MSNPSIAPSNGDPRIKRKLSVSAELPQDLRPESTEDAHLLERIDAGGATRTKLSARDLLAILSGRRISITEIKFSQSDPQDGGMYADIAVATLVRTGDGDERGRKVAAKKIRFIINSDMTEEKILRAFVNELRLLDKLSHPNIIDIIGFVEDTENRIAWLIFPWEENGNLREFLRSGDWEIPERVSLILDVACGLEYLHTRNPPIRHGDLKSLNILVNSSYRAVIADFGSAQVMRRVQEVEACPILHTAPRQWNTSPDIKVTVSNTVLTLTGPACSFRWAPPEYFRENPLDLASDIWALGWIAWEAITDRYPFEELDSEFHVTMKVMECQLPLVYDHLQLSQIYPLCNVMERCWNPDPKERPSVTECWKIIQLMPYVIPVSRSGKIRPATLSLKIGEMHRLQGRNKEAAVNYEQGLAIARPTGDQMTVANLLVLRGHNHLVQSEHVEAKASFTEALTIYESIGNDWGRGIALEGLGQNLRECGKLSDAEAPYVQALAIFRRVRSRAGQVTALLGLGDIQQARSNNVEAEASYDEALTICRSLEDHLGQAYWQNEMRGDRGDNEDRYTFVIVIVELVRLLLIVCKNKGNT